VLPQIHYKPEAVWMHHIAKPRSGTNKDVENGVSTLMSSELDAEFDKLAGYEVGGAGRVNILTSN
jgi:hypothetical protein